MATSFITFYLTIIVHQLIKESTKFTIFSICILWIVRSSLFFIFLRLFFRNSSPFFFCRCCCCFEILLFDFCSQFVASVSFSTMTESTFCCRCKRLINFIVMSVRFVNCQCLSDTSDVLESLQNCHKRNIIINWNIAW